MSCEQTMADRDEAWLLAQPGIGFCTENEVDDFVERVAKYVRLYVSTQNPDLKARERALDELKRDRLNMLKQKVVL